MEFLPGGHRTRPIARWYRTNRGGIAIVQAWARSNLRIIFAVFLHQLKGNFPGGYIVGFVPVGFASGDLMKGFHGFQVDARPHKGEHMITTFPGGEGTLIALNAFHLRKVNARCCLCLGKRGDGQTPESKEADDALGFKACDGNVHGLFIV